jgi:hypothetical protein
LAAILDRIDRSQARTPSPELSAVINAIQAIERLIEPYLLARTPARLLPDMLLVLPKALLRESRHGIDVCCAAARVHKRPPRFEWPTFVPRGGKRGRTSPKPRVSIGEANLRARDLLKIKRNWSQRELAEAIGCAVGQVRNLPAYQAWLEGQKPKRTKVPKAIALTHDLLQVIGEPDEVLKSLIDDQAKDSEPSPLAPSGRMRSRRPRV